MAKTIKSIKCPQCGSNKVKELRPDYYECQSCKTEFFLDSDDLTIHHKHSVPGLDLKALTPKIKKYIGLGILGLMLFLISLLSTCYSSGPGYMPTSERSTVTKKETDLNWDDKSESMFTAGRGKPHLIRAGTIRDRHYSASEAPDKKVYMAAYDPGTGKQEWIKAFDELQDLNRVDINIKEFEDGYLYVILNKRKLYRLDSNMQIENADARFVKENDALSVGVVKYEFKHPRDHTGLDLVTNEGKNLVYIPKINKAVPKKDYFAYEAQTPPQPQRFTGYMFSEKSHSFPDEKIQLVKYTYLHQPGYPKDEPRFGWDKDYGGSGIFTDRSPYVKRFITPYQMSRARVKDYKILAEDRTFFNPAVLAYNKDVVVIATRPTPSEDDSYQVQLLDAETGVLKQSLATDYALIGSSDGAYILPDGLLLYVRYQDLSFYDRQGKLVNRIKLDDLKPDLKK